MTTLANFLPEILLSPDDWYEMVHRVCWHQHGGSGSSITYGDLLRLPYDRIMAMSTKNRHARQEEIRQIQEARGSK